MSIFDVDKGWTNCSSHFGVGGETEPILASRDEEDKEEEGEGPTIDNPEEEDTTEETKEEEEGEEENPEYIIHSLSDTDTLTGLALYYGTSASEIIRLNGLLGKNALEFLPPGHSLLVHNPQRLAAKAVEEMSEEHHQRRAVSAFLKLAPSSYPGEARFYLMENQWKVLDAFRQWRDDLRWEQSQDKPLKKK